MKLITAVAAISILFAAAPMAIAQNAPTTNVAPSPNSINKGSRATAPSGAENRETAAGAAERVTGRGKFCKQTSPNSLSCAYASMTACEKHNKSDRLHCVTNPHRS